MPAISSIGNIGSMLDRAVVAWLVSQSIGTDPVANVVPANYGGDSSYPEVKCHSMRSDSSMPNINLGTHKFQFQLRVSQSAVAAVGDDNREGQRASLDLLVGQVLAQMLQSNDGQSLLFTCQNITTAGQALATSSSTNNADMAQFTLQQLFYKGHTRGEPSEPGAAWIEVINFEAVCNPVALTL